MPNQKLACAACYCVFENIISAAEHTIYCKEPGMEAKKRKKERAPPQPQFKFQKVDDSATSSSGRVCMVTLHWSRRNSALLLKCIHKRAHLFTNTNSSDKNLWQEIENEMKRQFPWVFSSICVTKWKKLKEETEKYLHSERNEAVSSSVHKPDFYYVIREISRRMTEVKEEKLICKTEEEEEDSTGEEELLADPDAIEDEPFSGVMDSQGNMHTRDHLLQVVHSLEANESCPDAVLAERHGVEEAIVEWVKENQEAVVKGSLRCSTCSQRILKREDYTRHELDCILKMERSGNVKRDGGYFISYSNKENEDRWSPESTSTLIRVFKERAPSFVSSDGVLRKGIWLEIFKELKPKHSEITPHMCCEKWTDLVNDARTFSNVSESKEEEKNRVNGSTMVSPPFYDEIADVVDLVNVEKGCAQSFIPKELIPDNKDRYMAPRVYLSKQSDDDGDDDYDDDDDVEESEGAVMNDSFEDTLSVGDSSEEEASVRERGRGRERNTWRLRTRLGDLERKVQAMTVRLKELEEQNRSLRQGNWEGNRDHMATVVNRLDRFLHNQNRFQTQQTESLSKMVSMWERHHRENMTAVKSVLEEVSKRKNDAKEKKSK